MLIDQFVQEGRQIYIYGNKTDLNGPERPLILDLNCTSGNPQAEVQTNGWDKLAVKELLLIVAPEYDDTLTYGNAEFPRGLIAVCLNRLPVKDDQIYSTGFSNGGATSIALASTYPKLLAGIATMGWAVGMRRSKPEIPFVLIQGSEEFTEENPLRVMHDEQIALHDLFVADHLISNDDVADYQKFPYWGYQPSRREKRQLSYFDYDWQGENKRKVSNQLIFSSYQNDEFRLPIIQTVLVPSAGHWPHSCNAKIAWHFLRHFRRTRNGQIIEI